MASPGLQEVFQKASGAVAACVVNAVLYDMKESKVQTVLKSTNFYICTIYSLTYVHACILGNLTHTLYMFVISFTLEYNNSTL